MLRRCWFSSVGSCLKIDAAVPLRLDLYNSSVGKNEGVICADDVKEIQIYALTVKSSAGMAAARLSSSNEQARGGTSMASPTRTIRRCSSFP